MICSGIYEKSPVLTTLQSFEAPRHGIPRNIRMSLIPSESSPSATFLPLIVCVYLLSNFRGELRETHHLCTRVRYGLSRSSKIVNFCGNRGGLWDFLLVTVALSRTVSEIRRLIGRKSQIFLTPLSFHGHDWVDPFRISGMALRILKLECLRLTVKISWS